MRYFWSLIVLLALVTAGLFTLRVAQERVEVVPVAGEPVPSPAPAFGRSGSPAPAPETLASTPQATPEPERTRDEPSAIAPEPVPAPIVAAEPEAIQPPEPEAPEPMREAVAEVIVDAEPPVVEIASDAPAESPDAALAEPEADPVVVAAEPEPVRRSSFSIDELLGLVSESAEQVRREDSNLAMAPMDEDGAVPADPMLAAAAAAQTENAGVNGDEAHDQAVSSPAGPAFQRRSDGSIEIEGVGVVRGQGTPQRPFVLSWDVLRSLSRDYNPRQGNAELPAWILELHDKHVRIEGNTLLPVVAQSTDELLLMQNPWDGCCLGMPPTPYDAIEVKLVRAQPLGNSPTGYGQVEGVFKIDPYIVSGWLLGLYLIEDASFESAAGITLPDF
ncbi:MAG: hypothetical protein LAT64_11505 [Phycisphaerales bacterium]|nr:hypothetical protein [Planctomycetota bacterium]MCH8509378.1 hypothetical protein [Phycisphaerales bacterium]